MNERSIYFNGIDLDRRGVGDAAYAFPPMPIDSVLARSPLNGSGELHLNAKDVIQGVDPNRLDEAGWGLVVHEREDPAVVEAMEPLIEKRRDQAGGRFRKLIFREGDTPTSLRKRHGVARGDANPDKIPYYLLVLGSPERIPFTFQTDMDISYAVGRLAFHRPEGYARYAENILAYEREEKHGSHRLHLFAAKNDEPLTDLSCNRLAAPIQCTLTGKSFEGASGFWTIDATPPDQATRERLLRLFTAQERPDILFTAGHGVVCSRDAVRRERYQGGLVCSDWRAGQPIAEDHCVFAHDLTPAMDLRGLVCFFFSCFTAGTPALETSRTPDQKSAFLHPHAFVGSLPSAMLQHDRGALAVIGHVEQCFQHSFLWHEEVGETDHFVSAFSCIMDGERVGHAMEHFKRRLADIATAQLARMYDPDPPSETEMRLFWLTFQDARYYVILGDPAARIQSRA